MAYSGGVDSAVLLAISEYVLGYDRTLGITAVSPSLAARERAIGADTAAYIGAETLEINTNEQAVAAYRANNVDRCYFCKNEMFNRIDDTVVEAYNLGAVAYGENADDTKRIDRPGARCC